MGLGTHGEGAQYTFRTITPTRLLFQVRPLSGSLSAFRGGLARAESSIGLPLPISKNTRALGDIRMRMNP
jgi:hypothetical protein